MSSEKTTEIIDVRVAVPGLFVNLSPLAFHFYSSHFLKVARSIEPQTGFSPVPYYLYCRSLELSLKAFLLAKGISKDEIKRKPLCHHLKKILKRADEMGLGSLVVVSLIERQELSKANSYYKAKDFEYANISRAMKGYPDLPNLEVLDQMASRLLTELEPICLSA